MDARRANDRIAEKAALLRFVSRVPMLCECNAFDCRTIVMIGLRDYRELRADPSRVLTAPAHAVDGAEVVRSGGDFTIRRVS